MSVTSVREIAGTRNADSAGISEIKLTRVWRVQTNNTTDDATVIFGSGLLPNLFDLHPSFPYCRAQRASVNQEKPPYFWIVTVDYSSKPIPQERIDRETYNDPTTRPVKVSMKSDQYTKSPLYWIKTDSNGNPTNGTSPQAILNSAGDHYDSLPEIDDGRRSFHFVKNYGVGNVPDWVFSFEDVCVNNGPVTILNRGCDALTLKMSGIEMSELQEEQNVQFYIISFDLHYKPDGWLLAVVDRGFNFLGTANDYTTKKKILNKKDGAVPTVPQLLDGNGAVLADPETASPVFLYGAVYPEEDFSILPLTF